MPVNCTASTITSTGAEITRIGCFRYLFVGKVKKEDTAHGAHQEDDIKPPVIEVELQIPKNLRQYGAVFRGHVHPQQHNRGEKVGAHNVRDEEDNHVRGLGACDGIEKFS